jgi:hypothetical protein
MFIYEDHENGFSDVDIAKVTNYIVSYACKGVEGYQEEKEQMSSLILSSQNGEGTSNEIHKIARKILNKIVGDKFISKQEAIVQILELNLFECSEHIETISLSRYHKLSTTNSSQQSFLKEYPKREYMFRHLSLFQYFLEKKNKLLYEKKTIPHFTGTSLKMKIPISKEYAKNMLLIHKPWFGNFNNTISNNYIQQFMDFLNSKDCPIALRLSYSRMILNSTTEKNNKPISRHETNLSGDNSGDTQEAIDLFASLPAKDNEIDDDDEFLDFGITKDWTIANVNLTDTEKEQANTWLSNIVHSAGKSENLAL